MTMRSFKHIGKFIRERRLSHPQFYSQNQLSKLLGYKNGQFISNVERGLCGIPLKGIAKLIKVLNIDSEELKAAMQKDYEETLDNFLANPDAADDEDEDDVGFGGGLSRNAQVMNA